MNDLLDNSHEMSRLHFLKRKRKVKLFSVDVVIGTLRVKEEYLMIILGFFFKFLH